MNDHNIIYPDVIQGWFDSLENGEIGVLDLWFDAEFLLDQAIDTDRSKSINILLDHFNIPRDEMTTKERITYYYLLDIK